MPLTVLYSSCCRGVNLVCTLPRRLLSLLLTGSAHFKPILMAPKLVRRIQSTLPSFFFADILGALAGPQRDQNHLPPSDWW
jgi:hypothetical protein